MTKIETPFFASLRAIHLLLVLILVPCASGKAAAPPAYTLTRVEVYSHDPDFSSGSATGINDQGHVTSTWWFQSDCDAGLNTGMFDSRGLAMIGGIEPDEGDATSADAINGIGQVTGYSALTSSTYYYEPCSQYNTTASGPNHAFRSDPSGGALNDLGTLGGDYSRGLGINTQGQVVGSSQLVGNTTVHGFVSGANDNVLTDIGTVGGRDSVATGVNDSGQVVGWSQITGNGAQHAFFRPAGGTGLRDIGTLGGTNSYATAINSSGVVVGRSQIPGDGAYHVFVSAPNGGKLRDIGISYDGFDQTYANIPGDFSGPRINDRGEVVWNGAAGLLLYTPGHGVDKRSATSLSRWYVGSREILAHLQGF